MVTSEFSTSDRLTEDLEFEMMSGIFPADSEVALAMVELLSYYKLKSVAVVYVIDPFGGGFIKGIKKRALAKNDCVHAPVQILHAEVSVISPMITPMITPTCI